MGAPGNGIKWFYFSWLRSRVSGVNTERTVTRRLSAAVMSAVPKQFTHVTHWSWRHTWSLLTFEFFFFFFSWRIKFVVGQGQRHARPTCLNVVHWLLEKRVVIPGTGLPHDWSDQLHFSAAHLTLSFRRGMHLGWKVRRTRSKDENWTKILFVEPKRRLGGAAGGDPWRRMMLRKTRAAQKLVGEQNSLLRPSFRFVAEEKGKTKMFVEEPPLLVFKPRRATGAVCRCRTWRSEFFPAYLWAWFFFLYSKKKKYCVCVWDPPLGYVNQMEAVGPRESARAGNYQSTPVDGHKLRPLLPNLLLFTHPFLFFFFIFVHLLSIFIQFLLFC